MALTLARGADSAVDGELWSQFLQASAQLTKVLARIHAKRKPQSKRAAVSRLTRMK
jgi:hypothetical protein